MKKRAFEIIHFGPITWEELQKTGYRKTSGATFKSLWERSDVEKIWYVQHDRRWGFQLKINKIDKKVVVLRLPIGFPYERFSLVRRINRKLQSGLLTKFLSMDIKQVGKMIYWFYDWLDIELIKHLPRATTVMEITDSAEQFHKNSPSMLKRLPEIRDLTKKIVDLAIVVNPTLVEDVNSDTFNVKVEQNCISEEFLDIASTQQLEPEAFKTISNPRLLVVGTGWSLNNRVNHSLLLDVLNILPDWSLVMIGCESISSTGLRQLSQHPRVTCLPLMPHTKLPAYIQHVDVCAVPYIQGPALRDTLKVYEYLACGKPVILTADEVREEFNDYIFKAKSANDFVEICKQLVNHQPSDNKQKLFKLMQNFTWDKRAEKLLRLIEEAGNNKQHSWK